MTNTLDRAFYGNAGYVFSIGSNFAIEPSALFRYMLNAPFQLDGNLRFIIKDAYWLACSYRMDDAIAIMLGADFGPFEMGYSYDLGMSDMKAYNDGTHEVYLGIKMSKNAKKLPTNALHAPQYSACRGRCKGKNRWHCRARAATSSLSSIHPSRR